MKILFDFGHPADVHYFKHLISYLKERGDQVQVLAREKDVTSELLDAYRIPYISKGKGGIGFFDRIEYTVKSIQLLRATMHSFDPDIVISHASPYLAAVAAIHRVPHIMFNDTEGALFFKKIVTYLKPRVYSPESFRQKIGKNLNTFHSYMELAYLHPDLFEPDKSVIPEGREEFVLLRFVANRATHDIGHVHLNDQFKRELVDKLGEHTRVWISSEDDLPDDLKPYKLNVHPSKIHDVIANASLVVGDGATVCSEAAMLGVPSIFINQNDLGYITELDQKYRLVDHFGAGKQDCQKALERALSLLQDSNRSVVFAQRREKMLRDKKNLTEIMIQIVENTASEIGVKSPISG